MRKFIALFMLAGILFVPAFANAQDAPADSAAATEATPAAEETAASPTVVDDEIVAEEQSFHQLIKEKFIEGDPLYMTPVLLCLIIGLAIALERIITLNMATTNTKKLLLKEKEPSMQFTTPEELGDLAVFFCSPAGNNVRGVAWNMDGGWTAQ